MSHMKNVFSNVLECIGNTPLILINRLNPNPKVAVYAKWEAKNPGGSIKDRAALSLIETAEKEGLLTPEKIIIEATSGNTGIGLAMVAAVKGYKLMLAMPETASLERQKILKALGAQILLTPGAMGTDGSIEEVYNMVRENPDRYFMPDQFNNPANPAAHRTGTGPEIYDQTDGRVTKVVVTLGTTGTAMGILEAMRGKNPPVQVIGVEPYPGHKVQGLKNMKESYMPGIFDRSLLDRVVHIRDEEAFEVARRLAKEEGIFAGMSSGAAMAAAIQVAAECEDGVIVAVLPDGGDRYLSTNLFTTLLEPDFRFYSLLDKEKIDFKPIQEGKVKVSVTAPTLDKALSLENGRRFLLADLLSRFCQYKGFSVDLMIPIADMDNRTIQGAIAQDMDLAAYTQQRVEEFIRTLDQLFVQRASRYPRTTEHAETIVDLTRELVEKGMAYEKLRSVYFDLSKSHDYGRLSGIDPRKVRPGTTVDLDAYEKLNPRDFTLLKRTTLAELKRGACMKTQWGNVIPTWHTAGVAMALHDLGSPVDIQVSSTDFVFPHLENVRAIGNALTGKEFANYWIVCEQTWRGKDDEENADFHEGISIDELMAQGYSPQEIRYWILSVHYRKPLHATHRNLHSAIAGLVRLRDFISRVHHTPTRKRDNEELPELIYTFEHSFFEALSDDLNVPNALAALFKFVREFNPVLHKGQWSERQRKQVLEALQKVNDVLGIFDLQLHPLTEEESKLISLREEARKNRQWKEADQLREKLLQLGVHVSDTPTGTRWERMTSNS